MGVSRSRGILLPTYRASSWRSSRMPPVASGNGVWPWSAVTTTTYPPSPFSKEREETPELPIHRGYHRAHRVGEHVVHMTRIIGRLEIHEHEVGHVACSDWLGSEAFLDEGADVAHSCWTAALANDVGWKKLRVGKSGMFLLVPT